MSNPINLEYSIYIENKPNYFNSPPKEDLMKNQINNIYPKANVKWVDSDLILNCQHCSCQFNWFNRKHHCRACGGVYCGICCNKYSVIPTKLINIPRETDMITIQAKQMLTNLITKPQVNKSLVCIECYDKISKLLNIEHIIKICEYLDLKDLYNILLVNKQWYNAGIHCLSSFRNIQYKPLNYIFNKWECSLVNSLGKSIYGHVNWLLYYMKTSLVNLLVYKRGNIDEIIEVIDKYTNNKTINCWHLMCSRKCNIELDLVDCIELIKYISEIPNYKIVFWEEIKLQTLIIKLIKKIIKLNNSTETLHNSIQFLLTSLKFLIKDSFIDYIQFINNLLNEICIDDYTIVLLCFEFNYMKTQKISTHPTQLIQILHNYLSLKLNKSWKKIIGYTIHILNDIQEHKKIPEKLEIPIIYPFKPGHFITKIISITELESNSKPLLLKIHVQKLLNDTKGYISNESFSLSNIYYSQIIEKKMIIKNDINLRKENIVASLIVLLQDKLIKQSNRGRLDNFEPIPTYKIIMLNSQIGLIEYVENSMTLKNISQKNYTLQNYILDNNKNVKIGIIKERFAKSLAISSCLSYVLGLGDRHAQNIMVTNNGQILHIDYGYILENPMHTSIVNNPIIRISAEMVDFLGGQNSEYYNMFKTYTVQVFDIFRLYSNLIINFYNILGYEGILEWDKINSKLTDRFMNGLSYKDIEIVLIDVIESSSKSYGGTFMDLCNEYGSKIKKWL